VSGYYLITDGPRMAIHTNTWKYAATMETILVVIVVFQDQPLPLFVDNNN